ncbi:MAG TPA: TetR/AcrR family transcriptional regulator, partial [Myxococcales bacterium]|nr:TetR/AcrR family transcriptional regulator [Myxococcales bacterium]
MKKSPAMRQIKQERAARTRAEIIEKAVRLFSQQGYQATTMVDLAKAIKLSPGALYWHFPTKEDILLAACEMLHARFIGEFVPRVEEMRKKTARDQLASYAQIAIDAISENRNYALFFTIMGAESIGKNERVAAAIHDAFASYVAFFANVIRYGQKTGEFRKDCDPVVMAHALAGSFFGMIIHQEMFASELTYRTMASTVNLLVIPGMLASAATTAPAPPPDP